jgi:hypothetical protein
VPSRGVFAQIAELTRGHRREAAWLALIGLSLAAFDVAAPAGGAYVVGLIIARYPLDAIMTSLLLLFAVCWLPHGVGLPWALEIYDLRRFRMPLLMSMSSRLMRRAVATPAIVGKQPLVVQGRDNANRFAERAVRELPLMMRAGIVFLALCLMAPVFAPFLMLCGFAAATVCYLQYVRLVPAFAFRQACEDIQRDIENALLALPTDEASACLGLYDLALEIRTEVEIEVCSRDLAYKRARDVVLNVALLVTWTMGAVYVVAWHNPPESFILVTSWGGASTQIFWSAAALQAEFARSRQSIVNLGLLSETTGDRSCTTKSSSTMSSSTVSSSTGSGSSDAGKPIACDSSSPVPAASR